MSGMIESGDLIRSHVRYMKARGLRPRTISARVAMLHRAEEAIGKPLAAMTRDDIEDYIEAAGSKPATKRVYLVHLRAFFQWAEDEGHLPTDPTRKVMAPKVKRGVPRPISEPDLARALAGATPRHRAWMMLAAFAGLRACEIALVCGEHVIRTDPPYLFLPETKGGGEATVPLSHGLLAELDGWPSVGPLWGDCDYEQVSREVNRYLSRQGIPATLHSLRHRFGTMVYRTSGHDLRRTQDLLRHASPATTAIYTQLDPTGGSAVVDALPMPDLPDEAA